MTSSLARAGLTAALLVAASPMAALAQDGPAAVMSLRGGVALSPEFPGADSYAPGPDARFRLDYVRLPGGFEFGSTQSVIAPRGFGLRTSLRYIGKRDTGDFDALTGLDDVGASLEVGLGLGYDAEDYRVYADIRNGVIGHNAWVAEFGADALLHPTDALTLTMGPRLNFGDQKFIDTYFGVDADESAASGLPAYEPDSGLVSVGVELGARYAFSESWGLEGAATFDRYVGDAADSPIVEQGSPDQVGLRLGVTRRITLGF